MLDQDGCCSDSTACCRRLSRRFAEAGVDFSRHAVLIPPLPPGEFYGLMRAADVFLDTIGLSGFNTAIQAIEQGLPVVTRDGRFMRGRLASGLLKRMGLTELIAATDADYVALAVEAARNAPHRLRLREEIAARRPVLFGDLAPVRSLEAWLLEVTARHAPA